MRNAEVLFLNEMVKRKDNLKITLCKIKLLSIATPLARKQLIANSDRELIDGVSDWGASILKSNIPLND